MSPRGGAAILGAAALLAGLPLALFAAFLPPDEYRATLGLQALDCDGPFKVYLAAVPALVLYGIGFMVAVRRWRRSGYRIAALACLLVCMLVAPNLLRAVMVDRDQRAECGVRERAALKPNG